MKELLKATEKYKWVSFDLFDTLMYRVVSRPELIFDLVEREYNKVHQKHISGFRKRRIKAEALARKHAHYREITIDKIYSELKYTQEICDKLKMLEKSIEISTCSKNKVMVDFLMQCKRRGQKVIVTTDMYLDRDTIENILLHIEVKCDRLFISCEAEKTKLSGELFVTVLETLEITPDQICHIGDNPKTDIQSPKKYGIQSFERLVQKNQIELYHNKKDSIDKDILNTFVRNHLEVIADGREEILARIGYSVVGPLLYDFCLWIHEIACKEKADRIAFVAREGYLIKQVYDIMNLTWGDKTEYVRVNKNLIRLPSLYKNPTLEQFIDLIPYRDEYVAEDFAQFLDVKPQFVFQLLDENGFTSNRLCRCNLYSSKFRVVFDKMLKHEREKLQEQYTLFINYMEKMGVQNKKILFVNNSVNGSAQRSMQHLLDNNIVGVQFTASEKCTKELGSSVKVWLRDIGTTKYEKQMFAQYAIVLEHLLFEMAGTAQYLYMHENKVEVKCEPVGLEKTNERIVCPIQEYALQFVRDWQEEKISSIIMKGTSFRQYMDFLLKPMKKDALMIGSIIDSDYDGVHKIFDVNINEKISYTEIKDYARIKWQHGYFMILKDGKKLNRKYDMEKRIKCFTKNIMKR